MLVASTSASSMPGSSEELSLSASGERGVGEELTVTAEGVADGEHRLFVFGERSSCDGWPANEEEAHALVLTPPGGELLPAGSFSRAFTVIPTGGTVYGVCAFLDGSAPALRDAWASGCFSLDAGPDCRMPELDPLGVIAAEEIGRKIVAEEEQQRNEREQHAREETERTAREEAAARHVSEEAKRKASEAAARCHVPDLHKHTLLGARRLLKTTHCRLGKVTVHRHGRGTLRVAAQAPHEGRTLTSGANVTVTLTSS
jgi:hypothetical protein